MGDMKIGEGKKFDASKVSAEGLSQEEIAEITKKNKRLIKIFQAYDTDGKAGLSSTELAAAMDDFIKAAGEDNKISKKEFEKMADTFNHWNELSGGREVSGEDLKNFMKAIRKGTKRDKKVSTQQLLAEQQQKAEAQLRQIEEARRLEEMEARAKADAKERAEQIMQEHEAEQAAKAQQRAEEARIKDLQTPKTYTVQMGESFTDLIKRSLAAQGVENPTDEQMKEAIEKFKQDNPGAVHRTEKGVEYLYAGAQVKIAGNLEDKANSEEITTQYRQIQDELKAEEEKLAAEDKEKQEKGLPPYAPKEQEFEMPEELKLKVFAPEQDWAKQLINPDLSAAPVQKSKPAPKVLNTNAAEKAGMKFDAEGNSTTHEGYKIMPDGTVQKTLGKNEFINYEFYPNGRFKMITYTKGDWVTKFNYKNNDTNRWYGTRNLSSEFTDKYDFRAERPHFL